MRRVRNWALLTIVAATVGWRIGEISDKIAAVGGWLLRKAGRRC